MPRFEYSKAIDKGTSRSRNETTDKSEAKPIKAERRTSRKPTKKL